MPERTGEKTHERTTLAKPLTNGKEDEGGAHLQHAEGTRSCAHK